MKDSRHVSCTILSVVALLACCLQSWAAEIADVLHLADDYPACSFAPIDAETGQPVMDVFVLAQWYKNVSVMESATSPCREEYRVRSDKAAFSIPAARCSGFRHGTTLEVRVKAPGYRMKNFRILRRPDSSDIFPHVSYLPINECGKKAQQLPLDKIRSFDEALKEFEGSYNRRQLAHLFGNAETYREQMIAELRRVNGGLDVAEAKKAYCDVVFKEIPQSVRTPHVVETIEPLCAEQHYFKVFH